MTKIVKYREGDTIPEGAKFLRSETVPDYTKVIRRSERINDKDPWNYVPLFGSIFGTIVESTHYATVTYYYYEVNV